MDEFGGDCTIEKLEVMLEELNKELEDLVLENEEYQKGFESSLQPLHDLQKELTSQRKIIREYEHLQAKTNALLFRLNETVGF
ncbi:hypothetical protein [Synechococcus sp. MU1617]|uniref:hypothetical protein n=1 Tax=Synechococcus sp. MU1617 TaxID=2508346 RepID=UPI001CF8975C|nr:hypothetical protein [Synechococcus sp. MU1617]MCB4389536.1 hypothetical protein [Synechococcus sp. MU1617]